MERENQILLQLATRRDLVLDILNSLPIQMSGVSDSDVIRFDTYEHNGKAYSFDLKTLRYYNFRTNKCGNLIDLLVEFTKKNREEVYSTIYLNILTRGILDCNYEEGYYQEEYSLKYPEPYDSNSLDIYPNMTSKLFLNDNIWVTTQIYWNIKYDNKSKRVIIPVYQDYELVGAIGRLNKSKVEKYENKYMPLLRYNKSTVLFGLDEYRNKIKETKKVILVESEKSVMKAWQYNSKIPVLAVGCSSISRHHIERLNILGVETIIWSQDKGIEDKDVLGNNIKKLKRYSNAKKIKYLDVDSCEYLEDKESIFDKDIETIKKCFNECLVEVER